MARGGITNKQAKYLAKLCRELRLPYNGRGTTTGEASITIEVYAERLKERNAVLRKRLEKS